MQKILSLLGIVVLCFSFSVQAEKRIDFVEFKDAEISNVARILASMTGANIAVTKEARTARVSLMLQKTDLKHAIEMLSRVAGLWYRYSKSGNSYIIMTEKQYQNDIVVYRDDIIKTFTLRHQNVNTTAMTIQGLFGDRVKLKLQKANDDFEGLGDSATSTVINRSVTQNAGTDTLESVVVQGEDVDVTTNTLQANDLSTGTLRQLKDVEALDANQASKLMGTKTPIYIATNRIHNLLFVRTSDENAMAEITRLVKASDQPTPQVLLEMKIVRISVGENYDKDFNLAFNDAFNVSGDYDIGVSSINAGSYDVMGVNVGNSNGGNDDSLGINAAEKLVSQIRGNSGTGFGFNSATGAFYEFFSKYITSKITWLEKNNQAEIMAKPILLASNNRPARLFIGQEQVVPVGLSTSTSFSEANNNGSRAATTTTTMQVERRNVGSTLVIFPSINDDRTVTLDIVQDRSAIRKDGMEFPYYDNETSRIQVMAMDTIEQSNIKTVAVAKDGLTIALGGMMNSEQSDKKTSVPVLGNIPFLGEFFSNKQTVDTNTQYVMLITPHILMDPNESGQKSRAVKEVSYDQIADSPQPLTVREKKSAANIAVPDMIVLTQYARQKLEGEHPLLRGVRKMRLPATVPTGLFKGRGLLAKPLGQWERDSVYLTVVEVTNQQSIPTTLDLAGLPGGWKAVAAEQKMLAAADKKGDSTRMYLISTQPFQAVISKAGVR